MSASAWPEPAFEAGYLKRQQHYTCRPVWNLFRTTPTVVREARFLERARQAGVPAPAIRICLESPDGRALLLVDAIEPAVTLREALSITTGAARAALLERVAAVFVVLHRARICHGALYDTHVLISPDGAVALIDFEKARSKPTRSWAAVADLARFFRRTSALSAQDRARVVDPYRGKGFPLLVLWWRLRA